MSTVGVGFLAESHSQLFFHPTCQLLRIGVALSSLVASLDIVKAFSEQPEERELGAKTTIEARPKMNSMKRGMCGT